MVFSNLFAQGVGGGGMGTGTKVAGLAGFTVLEAEAEAVLVDMRWALVLMVVLIVADFRYGWRESCRRLNMAKKEHADLQQEIYRWHGSRAMRRTMNKLVDYVVWLLFGAVVGKALLERVGLCYEYGTWAAAALMCYCEVSSIAGHFFYLHGVEVKKKSVTGFVKALAVAFAKKKDADLGESIEEALKGEEQRDGKK